MCAKCKQKRPCTKKLSIQKCPDILVLHLKRFSQMRLRTKLNAHVDFPITNLRLNGIPDVMSDSHEGKKSSKRKFSDKNFFFFLLRNRTDI
jgi:ubiquitin C-terminal hydrolase